MADLGWAPVVSLEEGIRRQVAAAEERDAALAAAGPDGTGDRVAPAEARTTLRA